MTVTLHRLAERPDLAASAEAIGPLVWPEFMFFDPTGELYFSRLHVYADYVVVAEDDQAPGTAIGRACSVPLAMDIGTRPRSELPGCAPHPRRGRCGRLGHHGPPSFPAGHAQP